jgi:hypothetical protein
MDPIKRYPLCKIAESVLTKYFPDLDVAVRAELAISVARQWLTGGGHAGFVTPTRQFWFQFVVKDNGFEVRFGRGEGNWGRALAEAWHIDAEEVVGLLHQLSHLCSPGGCRTRWTAHPAGTCRGRR